MRACMCTAALVDTLDGTDPEHGLHKYVCVRMCTYVYECLIACVYSCHCLSALTRTVKLIYLTS